MHNVFIFPGQGSQYIGMGHDLYKAYSEIKELYHCASDILGFNINEISFFDRNNVLNKTKYTQPAIFIHSIALNILLNKKNIHPSIVAGHSLGEFSALVSAGTINFEDALKIIKIRSSEMSNASKKISGGMAAIIGANQNQLDIICNQNGIVVPANYNSPDQTVISGELNAINQSIITAKKLGIKRAIKLNVSGAFHSPLMASARQSLYKIIKTINFNHPKIPIYQNVCAKPITDALTIKTNLIHQLEKPVKWIDTIRNINKINNFDFFEVGPGKVLSNINKRINSNINTINFDKIEDLDTNAVL